MTMQNDGVTYLPPLTPGIHLVDASTSVAEQDRVAALLDAGMAADFAEGIRRYLRYNRKN